MVVSLLFFMATLNGRDIPAGLWQGHLQLNDTTDLPFRFEVRYEGIYSIVFHNVDERIVTNEIRIAGDSVFIQMPVFDSEFKIILTKEDAMKGVWINHMRKSQNVIPFEAKLGKNSALGGAYIKQLHLADLKWEATFSPGTKDESKAIGLFKQNGVDVTGTFLTETGDYRFLEGGQYGFNKVYLSCFDGSHAFLFTFDVLEGDSLKNGHFYSGAHHHETWVAKRNEKFELRNPDSLTNLKPGFSKVDFSFKNIEGKQVSLRDEKYKGKVTIVQLMGTWCPNCMDETKFLAPFYDKYNKKGLEVIGLAFERTDDFNKAVNNLQRSKSKFNVNYDLLVTMKTGKDQASEALPMLNAVMAFPTTIYIDKKGVVRKIYTGFNGPATGPAYTKFVEDTTRFVEKLLAE